MEPRRVVITGMGAVTPLGLTVGDFWNNLLEAKNGIHQISPDRVKNIEDYNSRIAGQILDYDGTNYFDRKEIRHLDLFAQYGIIAATEAFEMSGLKEGDFDPARFGVNLSSGIGGMKVFEDQVNILHSRGVRRVSPFFVPMMISDIVPGHVSIKYNLQGPNFAVVSACATASHSIALGYRMIRWGECDLMLSGGEEAPITPIGVGGFVSLHALSCRNDDPETASRPFDKERDGFIIGEGAGALLLEDYEHARNRGAHIFAEIVGAGYSGDAYHITSPEPSGRGAALAMSNAIKDAGIEADKIEYINAHGTSTEYNDKMETAAIKTVFGEHAAKLKINSTKSMVGHLLGGAGGVEAVASIMSLIDQKIHPTKNYFNPDPECDLDYVPNQAISHKFEYALSNNFGFGGHNASLLFRRFSE